MNNYLRNSLKILFIQQKSRNSKKAKNIKSTIYKSDTLSFNNIKKENISNSGKLFSSDNIAPVNLKFFMK